MTLELISVIMPVRNCDQYVESAVRSILTQSYRKFELIVVDDHSQDQTRRRLTAFHDKRIVVICNTKQLGVAKSLNKALARAQGKLIARMDGDDISFPKRLAIQASYLHKYQQTMLVGTWAEMVDEQGRHTGYKKYPVSYQRLRQQIVRFNPFVHPSVMFRRELLEVIGTYDVKLDGAEDYDFFLRTVRKFPAVNISQVLLKFRQTQRSVSFSKMKHIERQALRVRWKALKNYGYPWWQLGYLVKPLLTYLVPASIKRLLFLNHEA